jgi:hypothetical protein
MYASVLLFAYFKTLQSTVYLRFFNYLYLVSFFIFITTVIQFLIFCLGFMLCFKYIYSVSFNVKGELSILMIYRVSIFFVLWYWPDSGLS